MGKWVAVAVTLLSGLAWSLVSYARHGSWPEWYVLVAGLAVYLPIALWVGHLYDRLGYVSRHDALTGLLNRRHLLLTFGRLLGLARRQQEPLAFLIVDVDDFKHGVNDRFGHVVGDQVLEQVAAALRKSLRRTDVVGRWGGEEFAVILPGTDRSGAMAVAERMREAVASQTHPSVTVCIGIAVFPEDGKEIHGLVSRADQALYAAKRIKNRTLAWRPEMEASGPDGTAAGPFGQQAS